MQGTRLPKCARLPQLAATAWLLRGMLCCGLVLMVAACGLQKGHFHKGHRHHRHHRASGAMACIPGDIRIKLAARSAGVAAGSLVLPLDFTNKSSSSCELSGLPSVVLAATRSGRQIGMAAVLGQGTSGSDTAEAMLLPAGRVAHVWLHVAEVANVPAVQCHPVAAMGLRVTLPGQRRSVFLPYQLTTCARRVQGLDILTIEPYQLGRAKPGTAQ